MNQLVPITRTVPSREEIVRSAVRQWHAVGDGLPSEETVAIFYAQWIVETGGKACWNWNLGNVKHVAGDGFDYVCLNGVWEGYPTATAEQLIASGRAVRDLNPGHAKQMKPGYTSVIFLPPDPQTQFRAFPSLDDGMREQLLLLKKRFSPAWPAVLAGDVNTFAELLHAARYFTASPAAYAGLMRPSWNALVESSTYEELVATMHVGPETEAEEVDPSDASRWDLPELGTLALQGAMNVLLEDAAIEAQRERDGRRFDEG